CRVTSFQYVNDSMALYGITSLFPEYSKINAVSDVVSSRPITPGAIPGAVPPTYITCPSSTANADREKMRIKKQAVARFMLCLLRCERGQRNVSDAGANGGL